MAPIKRYIEKFGREVLIEDDHPLVTAQNELDALKTQKTPKAKSEKPKE
jgi:hypothetical protein